MHNQKLMHPAVKLRHIRAFLDIASEGSLSAVARVQGITQPALSRTLAELEDLLAVALFRREGRRLTLTEQGTLFRHHAILGIQALEAGAAALRPGEAGGRIRVGVLPTAATRLFPRVALRFRHLMPEVVLTVETGPHPYLMRRLRDGAIDLTVGRMPVAAEMTGLTFEHLYEESVLLVARAGHPMAQGAAVEALRACPLVLPPEGAIIRGAVNDYLASQGLNGLEAAWETVALAVGRGIVLGSDALWFISRGVVAEELERGEMQALTTGAQFLSGAVGMTQRHAAAPQRGMDLLIQITRAAVADGVHG